MAKLCKKSKHQREQDEGVDNDPIKHERASALEYARQIVVLVVHERDLLCIHATQEGDDMVPAFVSTRHSFHRVEHEG